MKESNRLLTSLYDSRKNQNSLMGPMKLGTKADGFERKGQAWFVATELQSDLVVEVGDLSFHLHKFPLLSRSGHLNRLVFESRDTQKDHIKLVDMPGGPDAFELAAKFCYGVAVDLTASNIAAMRCAAEYLEMTEDLEEGNLISRTEGFLSFVVLASWKDSITVLHSCECLSPWAENVQIVRRCSESIAWKACTDHRGISWSFTGRGGTGNATNSSPLWNGLRNDFTSVPQDWWFEDIAILCIEYFVKVISAIKVKGMRSDLIGGAVVQYALKWLPGLAEEQLSRNQETEKEIMSNNSSRPFLMSVEGKDEFIALQSKSCRLLESIVSILPPHKHAASCSFLLRLLGIANMLDASAICRSDLERRVGLQMEQATLNDLLIPSFGRTSETLYDVELVQRIMEHFLLQEQSVPPSPMASERPPYDGLPRVHAAPQSAKMRVAKLIDSYLAEVARDTNLSLTRFQTLAEALPEYARTCDDGLYRAIDTYLKAHPQLTEVERKRLCRIMDCQKLSLDACMHAAQNERLPLRVVVQVLFCEQVKLRNAITGNALTREQKEPIYNSHRQIKVSLSDNGPQSLQEGWSTEHKDIKAIKLDVEQIKSKFLELQTDYESLQHQLEKLSKGKINYLNWSSGWKKLSKNIKPPQFLQRRFSIDETATPETNVPPTPSNRELSKLRRWRNSIS